MKKKILSIIAISLIVALVVGCTPAAPQPAAPAAPAAADTPAADPPAAANGERLIVGVSADDFASSFWRACVSGVIDRLEELGYEVNVQVAAGDPSLQNRQIDDMLALGVSAIVIAANDSIAIQQAVRRANEEGVPVVYLNRGIESTPGAEVAWGTGTDDVALTQAAMEYLADYARERGIELNVLELTGYLGDPNSLARSQGVQNAIDNNSDIMRMVGQVPTDNDIEQTLRGTTTALQENPEINAIFMVADFFLDAAISAMRQVDRFVQIGEPGHIFVVTFDGARVSIDNIRDGYVIACAVQDVRGMGRLAAESVDDILNGRDPGPFDRNPGFVLTSYNFDEMAPQAFGWDD